MVHHIDVPEREHQLTALAPVAYLKPDDLAEVVFVDAPADRQGIQNADATATDGLWIL
jgi:hypothetical protein